MERTKKMMSDELWLTSLGLILIVTDRGVSHQPWSEPSQSAVDACTSPPDTLAPPDRQRTRREATPGRP